MLGSMDVALIGAGRMGGRMARRLVEAGHRVTVCDPEPAAVAAAVARGAETAPTPGQAAERAELILCSLPDPATTEQAVTGPDGVLAGTEPVLSEAIPSEAVAFRTIPSEGVASEASPSPAARTIVDVGTGDPATARRLSDACARAGLGFLDAPVSGGVAGAERGSLTMMVGGEAAVLDACRPVLSVLAAEIVHAGPVGAGQVVKLCNNIVAATNVAVLGEVLVAGTKAGVDLSVLTRAIGSGSGGSYVLDAYLPAGLFSEERPTGFALDLMHKDIGLFMQAGAQLGLPLPLSGLVQQLYTLARADGLGQRDWTSVAEIYERLAGVRLREVRK
jgi:3-hydroxyisobutyrate dehydrogenase-like beta-hydroxyacid dehydrogenase